MPNFKKGDLVMSTVALPVARTALTKPGAAIQDPNNPQRFTIQFIPINSAPVEGLFIQPGVVFEVDAVLPWHSPDENTSKRYRLVLNPYHWDQLEDPQRRLSEAEFSSLNLILGEEDSTLPFYAYADDVDLVLVTAMDGRTPGETLVEVWNADDYFPWNIIVQFPYADDVLYYDIQAWLYDDTDEEEVLGFAFWLQPLYVSDPEREPLLMLRVNPDAYLDFSSPLIEFQTERKTLCRLDVEAEAIQITIQFRILVDLEQRQWRFLE